VGRPDVPEVDDVEVGDVDVDLRVVAGTVGEAVADPRRAEPRAARARHAAGVERRPDQPDRRVVDLAEVGDQVADVRLVLVVDRNVVPRVGGKQFPNLSRKPDPVAVRRRHAPDCRGVGVVVSDDRG